MSLTAHREMWDGKRTTIRCDRELDDQTWGEGTDARQTSTTPSKLVCCFLEGPGAGPAPHARRRRPPPPWVQVRRSSFCYTETALVPEHSRLPSPSHRFSLPRLSSLACHSSMTVSYRPSAAPDSSTPPADLQAAMAPSSSSQTGAIYRDLIQSTCHSPPNCMRQLDATGTLWTVHVLRLRGGGKRRASVLSRSAGTLEAALEELHKKSAQAVDQHVARNGFVAADTKSASKRSSKKTLSSKRTSRSSRARHGLRDLDDDSDSGSNSDASTDSACSSWESGSKAMILTNLKVVCVKFPMATTPYRKSNNECKDVDDETEAYNDLFNDGGRPLYAISLIGPVSRNLEEHRNILWLFWDYPRDSQASWLVFRRQLKRWQAFRKWQIDNRGLEDDDGGFPAFVEMMKRLHAKDESTGELAQLEADPSWLKTAWLEERRVRRSQRRWQRERGCNGFSDYVGAVKRRLARHGFTPPFQLQENPKLQDKLTTWIEYLCFEYWWLDRHTDAIERLKPNHDRRWQELVDKKIPKTLETEDSVRTTPSSMQRQREDDQAWEVKMAAEAEAKRSIL
ncbi:hypothetical protein Purlil1_13802 [Purpureocillium lilacinum]|uniref:Uncharacterized protein n=1 Tax=Purpureocillium lilacinum TaxID=33203 RepID=A0ABR0BD58_PURLI|nr:hypothetical protein Purlil1_13802 [Purpureocillium lilacinum]